MRLFKRKNKSNREILLFEIESTRNHFLDKLLFTYKEKNGSK